MQKSGEGARVMRVERQMPAIHETTRSLSEYENDVLVAVRRAGAASRFDLQEHLHLSRSIVSATVSDLMERGILVEAGIGDSQGGRRPQLFAVNGGYGYVAGVDVGATSVDLALADFSGRILERYAEPADVRDAPEVVLGRIADLLGDMVRRQNAGAERVVAIGIGVPGPVKFPEGVLIAPPLMPRWESFAIRAFMGERFPEASVVIDNDVNVMAIGEAAAGGGQGVDNFLFIKIGTGIGCGIISKGQIYRGHDGAAGDVGHICIDYNGPICHCGNAGCLEIMAGGPAIAARGKVAAESGESDFLARRLGNNRGILTAADVGDAAKAGDRAANNIVRDTGRMIGGMLAGLVNFYNPQKIFIGGGVVNIGIRLLSAIRQAVLRRSTALSTRHLHIELSHLGADAGVIGSIWLALDHVFEVAD
jgi:glucokinase-like ROK family protein